MAFAPPALIHAVLHAPAIAAALPMGTARAIAASSGAGALPGTYAVTGAGVNVRAAASSLAPIVDTVSAPDLVVSDGSEQNGYTYVTANGKDGWVASQFLSPAAAVAADQAPAGPDVAPGLYQVSSAGAVLRSAPSTEAPSLGTLNPGDQVTAVDGVSVNFFTKVTGISGGEGWVGTHYLSPVTAASGGGVALALSWADELQLRTLLLAWDAAIGHRGYGAPAELVDSPAATASQIAEVAAFQAWHNGTGIGPTLNVDGVVDQPTRAALLEWTSSAVTGANTPPGLPPIPGPTPGPAPGPSPAPYTPPGTPSNNGPLLVVAAAVAAAVILVEQKKKKKKKKAA